MPASLIYGSIHDADTVWTEWHWFGTRTDGQPFEMRGVTLFEIADEQITAGRLYMEEVEQHAAGIAEAVQALSGRRPDPSPGPQQRLTGAEAP